MTTNAQRQEALVTPTPAQISSVRDLLDKLEAVARDAATNEPAAAAVTAPVTRKRRTKGAIMNTTVSAAPMAQTSNSPTFDTLMEVAKELGGQSGGAKDTQIKFDLKMIEGAYLGALSLDPNRHGKGVDDAEKLGEAYYRAQTGAMVFNAKADNQRKLVSNVRKGIKLGSCPKYGVGEPMGVVNRLLTRRQQLKKDPSNKGKLDDAHNALMRFATAQLKLDTLVADGDLDQFIFKGDKDPRTGEEVLDALRKTATKLSQGKVNNCPDMDNSPEVQAIIKACTKRIDAIVKARAPGATQAP